MRDRTIAPVRAASECGEALNALARAAVAAGSFWRWDPGLSPQTQPELFASVVDTVNGMLLARGVETCPCANATSSGCDSVTHCGVMYCNKTIGAAV